MADVLKDHVERCPSHPMSKLKEENEALKKELSRFNGKEKGIVFVVFNNDLPVFYSFDEDAAENYAKSMQDRSKDMVSFMPREHWHVHEVGVLKDRHEEI
jgi:hypothetical protein